MPTYDDLRAIARTIPNVEESTSYGTPALKLKKKLVARLREDGHTVAMFSAEQDIEMLPKISPETFSVPQHYVGYGMLVIDLQRIRKEELVGLFQEAVKQVSKKLAATKKRRGR